MHAADLNLLGGYETVEQRLGDCHAPLRVIHFPHVPRILVQPLGRPPAQHERRGALIVNARHVQKLHAIHHLLNDVRVEAVRGERIAVNQMVPSYLDMSRRVHLVVRVLDQRQRHDPAVPDPSGVDVYERGLLRAQELVEEFRSVSPLIDCAGDVSVAQPREVDHPHVGAQSGAAKVHGCERGIRKMKPIGETIVPPAHVRHALERAQAADCFLLDDLPVGVRVEARPDDDRKEHVAPRKRLLPHNFEARRDEDQPDRREVRDESPGAHPVPARLQDEGDACGERGQKQPGAVSAH